ncbi:RNA-directed DNA polymerase from mobile element jockey [Araneus ventricosus]|uniref:RNA-directed DNA polymerase from mobile element jockey n=1 Tax=Araneus ventricosus TaxID=182803 RepID=A0A4Y2WZS5_ARAVE|nr:RNA-directed DNA polymerase from mobile element jockey [Araneus ventricosus]
MRKQHTKISALKGQSSIALSNSEKAETLADSLENQFSLNNLKDPNTENIVHNTILKFFNSPTDSNITPPTFLELLHHTNKINVRKAPGIDGISNKIIRNLPLITILKFYHLLTHIFKLNHFPTSWKTAVVIPILKPGKDPTAPTNYRPISLLPNFSKITEHFILQRLNEHFYSNNILIPFQFGFKPKLSTTHQLLRATETISAGFENKEHTGAVFLDIQKAFDRVWLNGLIYKLINYNTPPPLIKLITSFLLNRKFTVRVNATLSKLRCIQAGVPQGAKLSPLYSIFINDIPQKHNTTLCIYADDTAILAKNRNTKFITIALNKHIQELECWFHKWKIAINASKTEAVFFSKKRDNPKYSVMIQNSAIPWSQEAKYLGVILDKRLTWKTHINFIKQKFRDNARKLYSLIARNSSMTRENKVLIYTAILRPVLTYACPIWAYAAKSNFIHIDRCQNIILRQITKARWYMRNEDIRHVLNIPPIKEFIKSISEKFFQNLEQIDNAAIKEMDIYTPTPNTRRPRAILL